MIKIYNKIGSLLVIFCGAVLALAFMATVLNVVDMRIVSDVVVHPVLEFFVGTALYLANMMFLFMFTLGDFAISKSLKPLMIYAPIHIITNSMFKINLVISGILPIVYVILYAIIVKRNVLNTIFMLSLFTLATGIYQQISGYIKFLGFNFEYYQGNAILLSLYAIDLLVFYVIFNMEVKQYVVGRKFSILSKDNSISENAKPCKETLNTAELNSRQRVLFMLMVMGYQVFQLLVVLAIGQLNNMLAELLIMLVVFWIGRSALGTSYHSEKLWVCSAISFALFYILIRITPPLEISLFLVVVLTMLLVYLLHFVGVKSEQLEKFEKRYETDFTKYGLSVDMSNFAYDWKVKGLSEKELMDKYDIASRSTLNSRKRRVKEAIYTK